MQQPAPKISDKQLEFSLATELADHCDQCSLWTCLYRSSAHHFLIPLVISSSSTFTGSPTKTQIYLSRTLTIPKSSHRGCSFNIHQSKETPVSDKGNTQPQEYMVYREIADNGPMGSSCAYLKTTAPHPGERIYHGSFRQRTIDCGQWDANSLVVYDPVGEVTSEIFGGEQF